MKITRRQLRMIIREALEIPDLDEPLKIGNLPEKELEASEPVTSKQLDELIDRFDRLYTAVKDVLWDNQKLQGHNLDRVLKKLGMELETVP